VTQDPRLRGEVAEAAMVLSGLGLVTAFGHVSARAGDAVLITPAGDLAAVTAESLVRVQLVQPDDAALPPGAPAEAWAHLAVYRARPDAAAIARAQPPATFAAAAALDGPLPLLHGQAAWLGGPVPVHEPALLLRTAARAAAAAARLALPDGAGDAVVAGAGGRPAAGPAAGAATGSAGAATGGSGGAGEAGRTGPSGAGPWALLLRGNGALTLAGAPGLAVTRMWLLTAACETWLAARAAVAAGDTRLTTLTSDEARAWQVAGTELLPRLWRHLRDRGLRAAAGPG
jgi:ribulose-5-phosphate 4-epimerase/fuculose-1-phosphate aldolase